MNYMDFVKGGPVQVFVGERLKAGATPKTPLRKEDSLRLFGSILN
jgi:hypothetical protein